MKFCTSCGTEVEQSKTFCIHCGAKLDGEKSTENKARKASRPKKKKVMLGSLLAFIIVGFILFRVGASYTDKYNQLSKFEEYLNNGNVKGLVTLLDSPDQSLKVTENNAESLVSYYNENPSEKESLITSLREAVSQNSLSLQPSAQASEDSGQLIWLVQNGKKFFVYDNYDFVLQPFPLLIDSNYEEVNYLVDGKKVSSEVTENGLVNLGTFLPGYYEVEGNLSSDLVDLTKKVKVDHFDRNNYSDFTFDVESTVVETNVESGTVLIDGKNTDISISNGKQVEVGPVILDGSMTAQVEVETPFGKVKSEDVSIDDSYINVVVTLSDEQKEKAAQSLKQHVTNYSKALINREIEHLRDNATNVSDYTFSSFESLLGPGTNYAGYVTDAQVDWETFYLEETDGEWKLEVGLLEKWNESYDYNGDASALSESLHSNLYTLTYEKGKWDVVKWNSYDESSGNLKALGMDVKEQKKLFDSSSALKSSTKTQPESNTGNANTDLIIGFVQNYVATYVKAINWGDFSIVSNQIDPSATDYQNEVSDYIDYLAEKGMTEEVINVEVDSVEAIGDNKYRISTVEKYKIFYENGSAKYKSYSSSYEVRNTSDGLKMVKLLKTKEVDSRDF
ncbi:zinc ribbon domain-containing protein [Guptibacillus algicola]|uniref:zinc ribbon domain-containing protein n=1 Tax=Guptibacillus algicola TaxID=225844 RepID=UPI001CD63E65|nr:zinc-ribbon domain-containing protein [Alkalihalobacillus algicola]MCA0987024.1 zinc-ribbon domain-containing protein [Alkalihalobacillus algicola]